MAMYLNGMLRSYRPLSGKVRTANLPFLMGQMLPGMVDFNFKGALDEVKIFDYALAPAAVKQLFDESSVGVLPVLGNMNGLKVWPNPVGEVAHFEGFSGGMLSVFDAGGRLVFFGETTGELDTKDWLPGLYVAVLTTKDGAARAAFAKF